MGVILEKTELTEEIWCSLTARGVDIREASNRHGADVTNVLIVDPMPATNDANSICEARMAEYLASHPAGRDVQLDILRIDVDVTKVPLYATPHARFSADEDHYKQVRAKLQQGGYHGVQILGASVDHVPFNNIAGRHLITDIIDDARAAESALFTICNGSFEYLNHVHGVQKGVNALPGQSVTHPNPRLKKIIGHFQNAVAEGVDDSLASALARAPMLPTGRVGFMQDDAINALVEQGKLIILATSPDMSARTDAQIAFLYDPVNHAHCLAPHIEYGPRAITSEAQRDWRTPQGNTVTPEADEIPNWNLGDVKEAPWADAGRAMFAAWVDAINPVVATVQQPANSGEAPVDMGQQKYAPSAAALG